MHYYYRDCLIGVNVNCLATCYSAAYMQRLLTGWVSLSCKCELMHVCSLFGHILSEAVSANQALYCNLEAKDGSATAIHLEAYTWDAHTTAGWSKSAKIVALI